MKEEMKKINMAHWQGFQYIAKWAVKTTEVPFVQIANNEPAFITYSPATSHWADLYLGSAFLNEIDMMTWFNSGGTVVLHVSIWIFEKKVPKSP